MPKETECQEDGCLLFMMETFCRENNIPLVKVWLLVLHVLHLILSQQSQSQHSKDGGGEGGNEARWVWQPNLDVYMVLIGHMEKGRSLQTLISNGLITM